MTKLHFKQGQQGGNSSRVGDGGVDVRRAPVLHHRKVQVRPKLLLPISSQPVMEASPLVQVKHAHLDSLETLICHEV